MYWRDIVVLSLGIIPVALFTMGYLAGQFLPRGITGPLNIGPTTVADIVKGLLVLGIGLAMISLHVWRRSSRFHAGPITSGGGVSASLALALFFMSSFARYMNLGLSVTDLSCVMCLSATFVGLWLFLGIRDPSATKVILVGTYAVEAFLLPPGFALLLSSTRFGDASVWTRLLVVTYGLLSLSAFTAPLTASIPQIRRALATQLRRFADIPIAIHIAISGLCVAAIGAASVVGDPGIRLTLISDLAWVIIVADLAFVALTALQSRSRPGLPLPKPESELPWDLIALVAVCVGYLALSSRIASIWLDDVGPDGLSYLTIAREVGRGTLAVRGYWSPLISWLSGALIALGVEPIIALRAIMVSAGLVWILSFYALGKSLRLSKLTLSFLVLSGGSLATLFSVEPTTPDVLGTGIVLLYLAAMFVAIELKYPFRQGILLGLLGALAYFAKYYNLPFFVISMILLGVVLIPKGRRAMYMAGTAIASVFIFCSPWILGLILRYGELTITTSAAINHALIGPGSNLHHLCWKSMLCKGARDILFPWEDPQPSYYVAYGWSIFSSLGHLRHFAAWTFNSVALWSGSILPELGSVLPASIGIMFAATLLRWKEPMYRTQGLLLSLAPLLYASGYMVSWAESMRHYFPVYSIALVAAYFLLETLYRRTVKGSNSPAPYLLIVIIACLPLASLPTLNGTWTLLHGKPISCLREPHGIPAGLLQAPTAGVDESINFLAYQSNVQTYGVVGQMGDPPAVDQQVRNSGIKTLVVADGSSLLQDMVEAYGYKQQGSLSICGKDYAVLATPIK